MNDESAIGKEAPEEKILNLLEKRGPLTVREIAHSIHLDGDIVRRKLDGLIKDGEIIATRQGKTTVYCIIREE